MVYNLHLPHLKSKMNQRMPRCAQSSKHKTPDAMLHEIAFVLKMTQRIRAELEAKPTAYEAAKV